jgi:hypothetical protein
MKVHFKNSETKIFQPSRKRGGKDSDRSLCFQGKWLKYALGSGE